MKKYTRISLLIGIVFYFSSTMTSPEREKPSLLKLCIDGLSLYTISLAEKIVSTVIIHRGANALNDRINIYYNKKPSKKSLIPQQNLYIKDGTIVRQQKKENLQNLAKRDLEKKSTIQKLYEKDKDPIQLSFFNFLTLSPIAQKYQEGLQRQQLTRNQSLTKQENRIMVQNITSDIIDEALRQAQRNKKKKILQFHS